MVIWRKGVSGGRMQGSKMNFKLEKQFIDSWYLKTQKFRHDLIKGLGKHIIFFL